ncbi:MAG: transglycosylase SLT domain-containing protein [Chloroflexi bacterium]|nr:transglycosylase SLT domain-containing protein [Chloroflexota bacterium]
MSRARPKSFQRQAAAAEYEQGGGCFDFLAVPAVVLLVSVLLGFLSLRYVPPVDSASLPRAAPSSLSPIFRAEVLYWADSIARWAAAAGLDPNLAATVMQIESCGDPRAKSSAGAMGLFQVMPFHFRALDNPYDPETNAARGLAYLARSLAAGRGDARLALAGYNGGIGVISRSEWSWSPQTRRYVQYGVPIYEDARNGLSSSAALSEWYEKYGVGLCRQAGRRLGLSGL